MDKLDFPWRLYVDDELYKEYERLKTNIISKPISKEDYIPFSTIGFKCTNCFFQYERMNTPGIGRPSTIDYWKKSREQVIKFSNRENRDYFSTLNFFNHTPSQFPIVTASKIYMHFGATKIFDPYAGWGDRCLGAMACDIDYTGVDQNNELKEPFKELIKFYPHKCNVEIKINKSEDVDIDSLDFDFVLTSPPFWKENGEILERYNDTEIDYNTFMEESLIPVMQKLFKRDIWVCLYIPNYMYKDLTKIFGECAKIVLFKTNRTTVSDLYCWKFNT
jgi:hypothetical protein